MNRKKKNKIGVNEDRKLFYSDTQFLAIIRILFCLRLVLLNHTICVFIPEWEQITLIILKITPYQFDLQYFFTNNMNDWLTDCVITCCHWRLFTGNLMFCLSKFEIQPISLKRGYRTTSIFLYVYHCRLDGDTRLKLIEVKNLVGALSWQWNR